MNSWSRDLDLQKFTKIQFFYLSGKARELKAHLMIGGKRDGDAVSAKHGAGIAAIRDDNFLRGDDSNDRRRSNGVALRSLKLAPAIRALSNQVSFLDLIVHLHEASLHRALPLYVRAFRFEFLLHDFMQPILALQGHLKKPNKIRKKKFLIGNKKVRENR